MSDEDFDPFEAVADAARRDWLEERDQERASTNIQPIPEGDRTYDGWLGPDGDQHHVAIVKRRGQATVYVDGERAEASHPLVVTFAEHLRQMGHDV